MLFVMLFCFDDIVLISLLLVIRFCSVLIVCIGVSVFVIIMCMNLLVVILLIVLFGLLVVFVFMNSMLKCWFVRCLCSVVSCVGV